MLIGMGPLQGKSVFDDDDDDFVLPFTLVYEDENTKQSIKIKINFATDGNKVLDAAGNTGLHLAAKYNLGPALKGFLKNIKNLDLDVRNANDETPMMLAARHGKAKAVEILATHGADVNAIIRESQWSVLHSAASGGDAETVEVLLKHGATITHATWQSEGKNEVKYSPLLIACERGTPASAQLLIDAGCNPHEVLSDGTNVLHHCVKANPKLAAWFITQHHLNLHQKVVERDPLIFNVEDLALLHCFIANGVQVDELNSPGLTLLLYHCQFTGNCDSIIFLLENGANLHHPSYRSYKWEETGMTCSLAAFLDSLGQFYQKLDSKKLDGVLDAFAKRGSSLSHLPTLEMIDYVSNLLKSHFTDSMVLKRWLETQYQKKEAFKCTIAYENDKTKERIEIKVNLETDGNTVLDAEGNTGLHLTAKYGLEVILSGFFEHGKNLDPDVRNAKSETPMMLAARFGHVKVIEILASQSADVKAIRTNSISVLQEAIYGGFFLSVNKLLSLGAILSQLCTPGYYGKATICNQLFFACNKGSLEIAQALIDAGCNPHEILSDGTNLLHYCVKFHPKLALWLIQQHQVKIHQTPGEDPLIFDVSDIELLRYVLANGSKIDETNLAGETLLAFHCSFRGNCDVAVYLLMNGASLQLTNLNTNLFNIFMSSLCKVDPNNSQQRLYRDIDSKKLDEVLDAFASRGVALSDNPDKATFEYISDLRKDLLQGSKVLKKWMDNQIAKQRETEAVHFSNQEDSERVLSWLASEGPVSLYSARNDEDNLFLGYEDEETEEKTISIFNLSTDGNSVVDSSGNTGLHLAAIMGFEPLLSGFLKKGRKLDLNVRNNRDEPPIMLAARAKKKNVFVMLVENGADINATEKDGWSVLHEAALTGETEIVALLLKKGAVIKEGNWSVSETKRIWEPENFLQQTPWVHDFKCTPFIPACVHGTKEMLTLLINAGDNPQQVTNRGANALHFSAAKNPEVCRWLLEELKVSPHAEASCVGLTSETPIHYVSDFALAHSFFKHGAKPDTFNRFGQTLLLHHCCTGGNPEIAILALKNGADPYHYKYSSTELGRKPWVQNKKETCIPLLYFTNTLIHHVDTTYKDDRRVSNYNCRAINSLLVLSILENFHKRGVKSIDTSDVKRWIEITKTNYPPLNDFLYKIGGGCVLM